MLTIIMLILIGFSEMRLFLQMRISNDSFENMNGGKRTWANLMSSKLLKSLYGSDDFAFRFSFAFFRFLKKQEE